MDDFVCVISLFFKRKITTYVYYSNLSLYCKVTTFTISSYLETYFINVKSECLVAQCYDQKTIIKLHLPQQTIN